MGIFGQFFERMMDSIDEVEDVELDLPDTQDDSTSERLEDTNSEVRAEALRDMENQYDEPMDIFDRRIRESQEVARQRRERLREIDARRILVEQEREEERRSALAQAISEDIERTVRETVASEYVGQPRNLATPSESLQTMFNSLLSEATSIAHINRARSPEPFGQSIISTMTDDPSSFRGVVEIPRISRDGFRLSSSLNEYGIQTVTTPNEVMQNVSDGFDNLRNSLASGVLSTRPNLTQSVRMPSVTTSGNQDYFQLEEQLIEFAELVRSMMQAETPADLKMQQDIVSKHIDNILLKKKDDKKLTPSNEAPASVSLELELD